MGSWRGVSILAAIFVFTAAPEPGTGEASATDFCVQLTRAELPQSRKRVGSANECSIETAFNRARQRSRDNASNALDQVCKNNVTQEIAAAACTRVGMVVNTSAFFIFPPVSLHSVGDETRFLGHGIGDASNMNVCVIVQDLSMDIADAVVDTSCFFTLSRFSAEARARARCAVVCSN